MSTIYHRFTYYGGSPSLMDALDCLGYTDVLNHVRIHLNLNLDSSSEYTLASNFYSTP